MGNYIKPNDKIRFRDLLDSKRSTYQDYKESEIYRPPRRPLFDERPYRGHDQQYSPSDSDETIETTRSTTQKEYSEISAEKTSKKYEPSSLGIGVFNPGGIISESGFTPVLPTHGNAPSLAGSLVVV